MVVVFELLQVIGYDTVIGDGLRNALHIGGSSITSNTLLATCSIHVLKSRPWYDNETRML